MVRRISKEEQGVWLCGDVQENGQVRSGEIVDNRECVREGLKLNSEQDQKPVE